MRLTVCIGSSCHIKGSGDIVELIRDRLESSGLTEKVELAGSFCLGKCSEKGVTVRVDDEVICGLTRENFDEFFKKRVLGGG